MSTLKQRANAEADRVEAEERELEQSDETPTEAVNADTGEVGEPTFEPMSLEAFTKALESEQDRHAATMATLMGDDFAGMQVCDACNAVGFVPRVPFKRDPHLEQCRHCEGHGLLLTGSQEPGNVVRACVVCQGRGYVDKLPEIPAAQPVVHPQGWAYDPTTGLPIGAPPSGVGAAGSTWAPGFVPPGVPVPGA
jgi:hypothetical protein